ncbi:MAG: NAD(P)/FAD-dependent oxidoreductase [Bacilli bacterium]
MNNIYDCLIIGSGISGMTSSIYLKRNNLKVALIEKNAPGGLINKTSSIENYPGFEKIDGPTLSFNIFNQTQKLDVTYIGEEVIEVIKEHGIFIVNTNKNKYISKTVIVASGRKPIETKIQNEKCLIGRGISYCALCDGNLYKNKDVVVYGYNEETINEALMLSKIVNKVYIINPKNYFEKTMNQISKIEKYEKISILYNTKIIKLIDENRILKSIQLDSGNILNIDCLFVCLGNVPEYGFLKNVNIDYKNNHIIVNNNKETATKGIYAVGDVTYKQVYQLVTAANDGAIAAVSIINCIKELEK